MSQYTAEQVEACILAYRNGDLNYCRAGIIDLLTAYAATLKAAQGGEAGGYKAMFESAVHALSDIDKLLGMPEDGCNDPQVTVSALADFIVGHDEMRKFRDEWVDAQYAAAWHAEAAQGGVTEATPRAFKRADFEAALSAQQGEGEAVAGIQVPREGLPRVAQFIPYPAWLRLPPGIHDLFTATPAQPAERVPEGAVIVGSVIDEDSYGLIAHFPKALPFKGTLYLAASPAPSEAHVVKIVPRDCGYGWSAQAILSDGSIRYGTTSLFPTKESAIEAVRRATHAPSPARGDGGEE